MTVTATETIRKRSSSTLLRRPRSRVFTEQIATWWPLSSYGIFLEDAETVVFEDDASAGARREGEGRSRDRWGEVLDYEFASRVRFTWHPGRTETTSRPRSR